MSVNSSTKTKLILILATIALLSPLFIVYYIVDPAGAELMPKCIVKTLTGYDCPSCGIQRMLHLILHGQIIEALLLNPFMLIALPYLFILFLVYFTPNTMLVKLRILCYNKVVVWGYVGLFFIWWIVRNTNWWLTISSNSI